jgi:hypothetical protein
MHVAMLTEAHGVCQAELIYSDGLDIHVCIVVESTTK